MTPIAVGSPSRKNALSIALNINYRIQKSLIRSSAHFNWGIYPGCDSTFAPSPFK
jgi:hypothetical protein